MGSPCVVTVVLGIAIWEALKWIRRRLWWGD